MPAKIRLQRHGKKGRPFFHIVVADGRAPRDGKFIEKLGTYNPVTNPATIDLDIDKSVQWLKNGAQPTDTCRAILSYKGVLYKYHLLRGVQKGALTEAQMEEKFNSWMSEKSAKIQAKVDGLSQAEQAELVKRFEEEQRVNQERAKALAERKMKEEEEAQAKAAEETAEEAPAEEAEAPAAEETTTEE